MTIQMLGRAFVVESDRHPRRHDRTGAGFECVADVAAVDPATVIVKVQRPVVGESIGFPVDLLAVHRPCQMFYLRGCLYRLQPIHMW